MITDVGPPHIIDVASNAGCRRLAEDASVIGDGLNLAISMVLGKQTVLVLALRISRSGWLGRISGVGLTKL